MNASPTQRPASANGGRIRRRLLPLLAVAVMAIVIPAPAQALVINPTFETGLSTAAEAVINTAIGFYESTFSNNITVNIDFHNMTSGLGASGSALYGVSYADYKSLLTANATSANDATAVAHLPTAVPGGDLLIKSADARAVGFSGTPGYDLSFYQNADGSSFCSFTGDGCIGLNVSNTTTGGGAYSLLNTVEHEIDEVLGLGSSLYSYKAIDGSIQGAILGGLMSPEDLFRYSAGSPNFQLNACNSSTPLAYFSINGGANALDYFNNCNNLGDYGDWVTHTPSQVQDAFTNGTGASGLKVGLAEVTALDAIGYTLKQQTTVPEPAGVALFGVGFTGLFMARRRAQIKKAPRLDSQAAILM